MDSYVPVCGHGHGDLVITNTLYDEFDMSFECSMCGTLKFDQRWMCKHCAFDICSDCANVSSAFYSDKLTHPDAIDMIRRQLRVISTRESAFVGAPVGALLTLKSSAGKIKNLFQALYKSKLGYQEVMSLPHEPSYLVIFLSPRSARDVQRLLGPKGFDGDPRWSELSVEYYPGVRCRSNLRGHFHGTNILKQPISSEDQGGLADTEATKHVVFGALYPQWGGTAAANAGSVGGFSFGEVFAGRRCSVPCV